MVAHWAELAGWSSCRVGSLETSTGLQRPKSDSFMWPLLHSRRLSGLMSLQCNGSFLHPVLVHPLHCSRGFIERHG